MLFNVHGGAWKAKDPSRVPPPSPCTQAHTLTSDMNIVNVGLSYRCIQNNGSLFKALSDISDSIAYVLERHVGFKICPSQIGIMGSSAGALLSAIIANRMAVCGLYIGINGIYNVYNKGPGRFPRRSVLADFGIPPKAEPLMDASPLFGIPESPPPTLLLHGEFDTTIHWMQSFLYGKAIARRGGYVKTVLVANAAHNLGKRDERNFKLTIEKIKQHIRLFSPCQDR